MPATLLMTPGAPVQLSQHGTEEAHVLIDAGTAREGAAEGGAQLSGDLLRGL